MISSIGFFFASLVSAIIFYRIRLDDTVKQLLKSYKRSSQLFKFEVFEKPDSEKELFQLLFNQFKLLGILMVKVLFSISPIIILVFLSQILKKHIYLESPLNIFLGITSFIVYSIYIKIKKLD